MNTIKVKVNFKKGTCEVTGIKLVTGDYNSTIIKLTMSDVSGTNIFNMKSPSDNLVLSTEIVNGEVPLYRETEEGIKESILAEKGNYTFEIAKYDGDSKLTSAYGKIPVRKAQVNIDGELIEPYLPVFDGLLSELSFLMNQVNNLNIAVEKEGNVTTLTITDKIGEEKVIQILDGEKGDRGERGPRGYDGNPTFYVGDFNDKPSEAEYVVEITNNGVKEHIKNYSDETGEFIDVPRATPTSDMNSTSSMSVPTTQAVKKYVAEHGADATNEISISPNQPTEANYKLWFPGGTIKTKASEVINSMSGNQTDLAPSVDAVKNYVNSKHITYLNSTQLANGFTPTEDCYIEVYGASSGWGYGGAKTELVISNTAGNAEQIVKTQAGTQGHDSIPDSMFTTSVYKLTANVLYKFTLGGVTGGNIYSEFYGKLIPFI